MHDDKTTKRGRTAADAPITTASPTGQEELEQAHIAEQMDQEAPPSPQPRKKGPPVHHVDIPQNRNSKHTGRSPRADDKA